MCQRWSRLGELASRCGDGGEGGSLLAQLVVVVFALALLEEDFHALRHVDAQEHVRVADDGCDDGEDHCLGDGVGGEVLLAKDLHLQVPFDDEGAVQPAEDADHQVEEDLEEVP